MRGMSAPWMPISPQRGLFKSASQFTETVLVGGVSDAVFVFLLCLGEIAAAPHRLGH